MVPHNGHQRKKIKYVYSYLRDITYTFACQWQALLSVQSKWQSLQFLTYMEVGPRTLNLIIPFTQWNSGVCRTSTYHNPPASNCHRLSFDILPTLKAVQILKYCMGDCLIWVITKNWIFFLNKVSRHKEVLITVLNPFDSLPTTRSFFFFFFFFVACVRAPVFVFVVFLSEP